MSSAALGFLAILAGTAIAGQAAANARLGVLLHSSILATGVAFFASLVVTLLGLAVLRTPLPDLDRVAAVPPYLWVAGGLMSAFGVGVFYWLIPQLGVSRVVAYALTGQLLLSMIASHLGWFQLPVVQISPMKLLGAACLILGVGLIQGTTT
ncbi:Integral membrane protein [Enhygromyxa salina]|uniref:Integral membrane protein n=1 Tax=Enhygromyxa salina TaxID=215803 RepID=A0A0C2D4G0_9BACT|nr:DMT family transporter [Enhygromyxa salina]KIG18086.1 Integral membrane protein [Enhygromyxa salina]